MILDQLDFVVWLRRSAWGYASVNALHIFGIGLLIGSIANVDLRIAGMWRADRWKEAMVECLPLARFGFGLAVLTGLALLSVRVDRYFGNAAFLLKMGLLALALSNVVLFHRYLKREERSPAMRLSALASLMLWLGILGAGRAIGFV